MYMDGKGHKGHCCIPILCCTLLSGGHSGRCRYLGPGIHVLLAPPTGRPRCCALRWDRGVVSIALSPARIKWNLSLYVSEINNIRNPLLSADEMVYIYTVYIFECTSWMNQCSPWFPVVIACIRRSARLTVPGKCIPVAGYSLNHSNFPSKLPSNCHVHYHQ